MRAEYPPHRIGGSVDAVGRNAVERRQPGGGVMLRNAGSYRHGPALALFEAYNICGRCGWEGDLMAVVPDRKAMLSPVIPERAPREPGIHFTAGDAARWIPGSMLRIAPE